MAKVGEEEVEYESDPEEEKRLLGMRRREAASDDEEEGEGEGEDEEDRRRMERRGPIRSDESDGQGGAADYDEDEEELDEEEEVYEDEEEEVYEEGEEVYEEEEKAGGLEGGRKEGNVEKQAAEGLKGEAEDANAEDEEGEGEVGEEGKKENEPFAVPTAGAFYMHDDRFRDNAGGRNRRTYGGRKLWESKDDKKWGHDKFEELTSQDRNYEQGRRTSKGRYRARGGKNRENRVPDNGFTRRSRPKTFGNGNNQVQAPKSVRGRGPRKYDPTMKNSSQGPPMQNRQSGKGAEKSSHASSGRVYAPVSNAGSDQVLPARKHSSLNSASPPFYPSGTSNKDISLSQKRDVQAVSTSRNLRTSVVEEGFSAPQTNSLMRGKNIADATAIDRLHIDDSITPAGGKPLNNVHLPLGASLINSMHSSQSRAQGRGIAISVQSTHQSTPSHNQVNRAAPTTLQGVQRTSAQGRVPSYVESPGQQSASGSQASSPPKTALSVNSYDGGDGETAESSKTRTALVGKGKGSIQGSGRGSFLYGGPQVMGASGNMGVGGHGDQNFPAFLPVMQFGGQHPGGIGVPAVGMAFPGYVAQPQLGLGNSEMTWLPVLAGAAGALGATYCSPYLAVDGAYHARPSGQASSLGGSSKENNNRPNNEWKPSQKSELVSDELGQRQKPRRYSEMDFNQPSTRLVRPFENSSLCSGVPGATVYSRIS
ncbi:hypothetical protein Tsubulata_050138 [Turnera subulata]|uniref:Btz domain-containing protein n=1 Tax=Turnera subulata TaxID=218843 RepID=A0A9Q0FBZ2_9ROSI|nr:hypothetical protein Tsubulata_050138 [Turnera subulata]